MKAASVAAAALALPHAQAQAPAAPAPLIDIHQHQNAGGGPADTDPAAVAAQKSQAKKGPPRTNEKFFTHQKNIGAVTTVLLGSNEQTIDWAGANPVAGFASAAHRSTSLAPTPTWRGC